MSASWKYRLLPVGLAWLLPLAARAADGPKVIEITKADDGEQVVFVVEIERPKDMEGMSIEKAPGSSFSDWQWPRLAILHSNPEWRYNCYLEYDAPESRYMQIEDLDPLVFIGRGPRADSIPLKLRYPIEKGAWRDADLTLELSTAKPMKADPPPRQRWALARNACFSLYAERTNDPLGFYTLASAQTRRQHLPAEVQPKAKAKKAKTADDEEADEDEEEEKPQPDYGPAQRDTKGPLYDVMGTSSAMPALIRERMERKDTRGEPTVAIKDIKGVEFESRSYDKLRGEREAKFSVLDRLVPADCYYAHFGSVPKLIDFLDFVDSWFGSFSGLANEPDHGVRARVEQQLCLPTGPLAKLLGAAVVDELAITGSDPYLIEGSDFSVLFKVTQKDAFNAALSPVRAQALSAIPGAKTDKSEYKGVRIERLTDPQRRVSANWCWFDDLCIVSNSLPALQRIVDAHAGGVPRLADAADFKYTRAVTFPFDPQQEDGFLYFSDGFIRRLIGPELRIAEKHRREAATSLRLLTNAALLDSYDRGPQRTDLKQLAAAGALDPNDLFDPAGGEFAWDPATGARSSTWGDLRNMTPLVEVKTERVTDEEREAYENYRDQFEGDTSQFLGAVALRLKIDRTIRVELCYRLPNELGPLEQAVELVGGEPLTIQPETFAPDTIGRVFWRLNEGGLRDQVLAGIDMLTKSSATSEWIGDWATAWMQDRESLNGLVRSGFREDRAETPEPSPNDVPFVVGLHVKDAEALTQSLKELREAAETAAGEAIEFKEQPAHRGIAITRVSVDPTGGMSPGDEEEEDEPTSAPARPSAGPRFAAYYAGVGDGLYFSPQLDLVHQFIDRQQSTSQPAALIAQTGASPGPIRANIFWYVAPAAVKKCRSGIEYLLEQGAREAAIQNMRHLWLLGRCGVLADGGFDEALLAYLGQRLTDPDGATYKYDPATSEVSSSVHGPLSKAARLEAPPETSQLKGLLDRVRTASIAVRLANEEVRVTAEIQRP